MASSSASVLNEDELEAALFPEAWYALVLNDS